jgi:hypothetical protein
MSQSNDQPPNPSVGDSRDASGRYRFQAGQPVDPDQGVHPELLNSAFADSPSIAIPQPDQQQNSADRSRRSGRGLLPMQAMSRRCSKPFRLKRRLKR